MSVVGEYSRRRVARRTCIAIIISSLFSTAHATPFDGNAQVAGRLFGSWPESRGKVPNSPASTHTVTTCADDGSAGSLRTIVESASTVSGDTIDFSPQLACDTIHLSGELVIAQDSLVILGPQNASMLLDGNGQSRVINHTGNGTLDISALGISHGYVEAIVKSRGGCISSSGNLILRQSRVTECVVSGPEGALGGAIYSKGDLVLTGSTISGNHAYSSTKDAEGGGAYVEGAFSAKYSVISDNYVADNSDPYTSHGGGAFIAHNVNVLASTFATNRAEVSGGLHLVGGNAATATFVNSTISSNIAYSQAGGVESNVPLAISNSTIAFNRALGTIQGGGLYLNSADLHLESSIVADNTGPQGADDIFGSGGIISGSHNLVVASPLLTPPFDTRTDCPYLQPLALNGGPTPTHALGEHSFALDWGNNLLALDTDQRLAPREVGFQPDAGAVERQVGEKDERLFASGFDGLCDQ